MHILIFDSYLKPEYSSQGDSEVYFEIIADSDSKPSKTSRKVLSDTKNFSSFHFIRDYGSKITWPFFEVKNQNLYYRR